MKIKRVFHHFSKWEDHAHGMYDLFSGTSDQLESLKSLAVKLLSDEKELNRAMVYVAFEWRHSAEVNLSHTGRNRQAWLGQAACCHRHGVPEEITRAAWCTLNEETQRAANAVADEVIFAWENKRKTHFSEFQLSLFDGSEQCRND